MKRRFLATVDSVAEAVREGRKEKGWTQAELAVKAKVGRRFIVELESGHMRAELGKVLGVLRVLDIHAVALPSVASNVRLEDIDLDEELKRFG
ncbi:helix-turn-helix domain-containing protein [Paeniglutamicibacter sp.]|uniref:helix-turn-helix domain-containing protein n=1 Tax=Paeniglutamicibacter sp. TaxID=1934391 RepID=UPI0039893A36